MTYCFPYLCCNVYLCRCFSASYGPSCRPAGVWSSCVPFLGYTAMLSVLRWQHLRCCGGAGCCTLTTFEIKPQAWHGRLPRICVPPVLYGASLILSHHGYYNKCGCVAGINSISPSSSGNAAPSLTTQIKTVTVSNWSFARGATGWKSSAESTTTSEAISQDDWLVSGGRMILFALTLCHFTVYLYHREKWHRLVFLTAF